jgi:hypothetical protein
MLRPDTNLDLYTLLFLGCLLLIYLVKKTHPKQFKQFIALPTSNYLHIYSSERKLIGSLEFSLLLVQAVNMVIFASIYLKQSYSFKENNYGILLLYILGYILLLLGKYGLEYGLGMLLEIPGITHSYLYQKLSCKNFLGLCLLPINMFVLYQFNYNTLALLLVLFLSVLSSLFGLVHWIRIHQSLILKHFLYLILYLCTLEIGPLVVLYQAANRI